MGQHRGQLSNKYLKQILAYLKVVYNWISQKKSKMLVALKGIAQIHEFYNTGYNGMFGTLVE